MVQVLPDRHPADSAAVRLGHDEYTHYYYAQALYILGDNGWEKLFGPTPEDDRLTWTQIQRAMCDRLMQIQGQRRQLAQRRRLQRRAGVIRPPCT